MCACAIAPILPATARRSSSTELRRLSAYPGVSREVFSRDRRRAGRARSTRIQRPRCAVRNPIPGDRADRGRGRRVYLAEDQVLMRKVAVKRLDADSPGDATRRFVREAKIGAALNHPNLVTVFDAIPAGRDVLIVMEYVDGLDLGQALKRGPLRPVEALSALEDVAAAIDHAHGRGSCTATSSRRTSCWAQAAGPSQVTSGSPRRSPTRRRPRATWSSARSRTCRPSSSREVGLGRRPMSTPSL